jgi:beta-glucanase (GH16 family)
MAVRRRAAHAAPRPIRLRTRLPLSALAAAAVVSTLIAVPLSQTVGSPVASAQPTCNGNPDGLSGTWACTFDDEFNEASLNTQLWQPMWTATSGYVAGDDCYVDVPQTISVSGGDLNLSAVKEPKAFQCVPGYSTQYATGMVTTRSTFDQKYGAFEVRAKLPDPDGAGLQETFWLYPQNLTYGAWPASGEIDFAEFYGSLPDYDIPFVHYSESASDPNITAFDCTIDPTQFNTYGADWTPTTLTILYNGHVCLTDKWLPTPGDPAGAPFNQPFFLALTQALGLTGSNALNANTPLPATTEIDWVRAWEPAG